jgi:predicted metalloprotease with PDZ domain
MIRLGRYTLLAAVIVSLITTLPGEVPCCELSYEVRPNPDAGVVDVSLAVYGFDGDSLVLVRPSARPLVGLLAQDPEVKGTRGGRWDVVNGAPRWTFAQPERGWSNPIRIRYRLAITAERPVNAWSVGLDRDLLYAPAEALFLTPEMPAQAAMHAQVRVRWRLPREWEVVTGWDEYAFHGVRSLLRTNVLAGPVEHHQREACGLTVEFAAQGEWAFDRRELADDLAALTCATRRRLGDPGIDRLSVMLVPARFPMTSGNRNGPHAIGLVHRLPDGSRPSIRLLAHELVHLWQQYDAPLWFQEGVNDYLALRIAHEAELLDAEEYFGNLAAIDATYRANPQRRQWSFDDEAREAPAFGPSDEYLAYRKGAMVGLALDRELRMQTDGEIDVAVLWRDMNDLAVWGHVRWTANEIADRAAALVDSDVSPFFGRFVHGTADLPRPKMLLADLPPLPEPRAERGGLGRVAAFIQATLD